MYSWFCCSSACGAGEAGGPSELPDDLAHRAAVLLFNTGKAHEAFASLDLAEADEQAAFVVKCPGLDTKVLGEYMCAPASEAFVEAYVNSIQFEGLSLDLALRRFLSGFQIPGEAENINRIMEAFARRYSEQSDHAANVVFVLSVALITLNTKLHDPGESHKPTCQEFQTSLQGADDGKDLFSWWTAELYESIAQMELLLDDRYTRRRNRNSLVAGRLEESDGISLSGRNNKHRSSAIVPNLNFQQMKQVKARASVLARPRA